MHKLLFFPLLLAAGPALAQSAPPRPAPVLAADAAAQPGPYCVVTGTTYAAVGRQKFTLSYGENAPKSPENQLFVEQQKLEALRTPADLLNYLGTRGWELVSTAATVAHDDLYVYQYVFRKRPTP